MNTIFQNTHIELNTSKNRLEINLQGSIPSKVFRKTCEKIKAYAQQNKVSEWLIDQKTMSVHPQDYQWFFEEFIKQNKFFSRESYVAIVIPKNFYCEFTLNQYLQNYFPSGTLNIARFDKKENAIVWLNDSHQVLKFDDMFQEDIE